MRLIFTSLILFVSIPSVTLAETPFDFHGPSWTGFYTGVSLGAIINDSSLQAKHFNFLDSSYDERLSSTDVLPGIHAGYNYQLPSGLVLGGEGEFTYPDSKSEFVRSEAGGALFDRFTFKNRLQGAIRGRIGYALDKFLPYVTSGVSFADTGLRYENEAHEAVKKDSVQVGWLLGAGLEYAFFDHLSVRAEYLYTDYNNPLTMAMPEVVQVFDPNGAAHIDLVSHSVKAALNYRF